MVSSSCPILHSLQECKTLSTLRQIHAQMITTGLILHTYPLSRLLLLSSTLTTGISYVLAIFNQVQKPTIFLYNVLISSLVKKGQIHVAVSFYTCILGQRDLRPNGYTYPSLFKACSGLLWLQCGRALHAHVLKFVEPPYDQFVQASLLNFYSGFGKISVCRYLFDQVNRPDLATWNSILSAYARNSDAKFCANVSNSEEDSNLSLEVLHLFNRMQNSSVKPNEVTLVALIIACADLGALGQGMWLHAYLLRNNLNLNGFVGSALITMYSNCGVLQLAYELFDKLPKRDIFCYNAMIRGLAIHGHAWEALDLFKRLTLEGLAPDGVTILAIICACSHVGLVEEGCRYLDSMQIDYGFEPQLEHYGCLVDLLGRAGRLKEAKEIIQAMPLKPNAVLWRSLLGAARVHGDSDVGKIALKNLIELEPETGGNYVLLSNIYATMNRWDEVKKLRKLMKERGINKLPGTSIVEIHGAIHEFSSGDKTHPEANRIYLKLEEINRRLQEHGHKPRTREVLFDIEEEEKEDHLTYHSERLAIAFALIHSNSGSSIRIIKNLRVCNDCHESTKLISRIYGREIIVRDRTRFHNFRDGICSCLDYW